MELFSNLALGLQVALSGKALLFCFLGVTVGTFVGVLPGVGAMAAVAMALPLTFQLEPVIALIMLGGIFYGAQYGGAIAAILLNIPGTASSAVTCIEGYAMTRAGRAGRALFLTAIASYFGGTLAIIVLMAFAPALASFAIRFGSAEYFSLMLLGLIAASTIGIGSPLKGLAMVIIGLVLGLAGTDVNTGQYRFTFGILELSDGISLVALAMGLFGVAEILASLGTQYRVLAAPGSITFRSLLPSRAEMKKFLLPALRGSVLGSCVGALPGAGPTIASFIAYATEKKIAKDPERFGEGAVEGLVAPEASNNAAVQAAFIPTLSLGVPGDPIMAILLGAMLIQGIAPGPGFVETQREIFWGLVVSFWIGNLILLVLNIPLIGIWVRILSIPYRILCPAMLFFICIGVYSVNASAFDVYVTIVFGVFGYFMASAGYPAAPLLLGFVLGPLIEENFRRALVISGGDFTVFVTSPLSAAFLVFTATILAVSARQVIGSTFSLR